MPTFITTMASYYYVTLLLLSLLVVVKTRAQHVSKIQADYKEIYENEIVTIDNNNNGDKKEVEIKLLYEVFCPGCRQFDTTEFLDVVKKLHSYLDIYTYPYGNAKTFVNDGVVTFKCQHGDNECYGNKLHACALDKIQNQTEALIYNSCMMAATDSSGSNDDEADRCAKDMGLDSEPIKACAKGDRGTELLKYYGEESRKIDYHYVPYVLINGKEQQNTDDFMSIVCEAFKNPPPPCKE